MFSFAKSKFARFIVPLLIAVFCLALLPSTSSAFWYPGKRIVHATVGAVGGCGGGAGAACGEGQNGTYRIRTRYRASGPILGGGCSTGACNAP